MKKWLIKFALGLVVLATSWSLLRPGFFRVHDYVHAARIVEMQSALAAGQFPVRWSQNFGYGYGMPLFEFYAPLPYFIGALFYSSGLGIILSIKLLFLASSVFIIWGGYKLGHSLFSSSGGLLVAALLGLAPYRAVNLFVRGALSEAWGMMALPWILYHLVELVEKKKHAWWKLVVWLVVLMLSHNITTMFFVPISLLFACCYMLVQNLQKAQHSFKELKKTSFQLVGSYLLAIGLAAFYIFPALLEKNYTQVDQIFGGYFHYSQHFLYIRQLFLVNWGYTGSVWGPDDGISFFLGFGQLFGLLIAGIVLLATISKWIKSQTHKSRIDLIHGLLYFGLLLISIFMSLFKSESIWKLVPSLQLAQFPWRWLSLAAVFLCLFVTWGVVRIEKNHQLVWLVVFGLTLLNAQFFRPEKWLENSDDFYYTDTDRIRREMSSILPDYIPIQMSDMLSPPEKSPLANLASDEYQIIVDDAHQKLVSLNLNHDTQLEWSVAYFPGWKAQVDGMSAEVMTTQQGTIQLNVPAGEHRAGLIWGETPVRATSDAVSFISLLFMLYLTPLFKLSKTHD